MLLEYWSTYSCSSPTLESHQTIYNRLEKRTTDMYTPLALLTGKIFQYMVQPIFMSLPPPTTTHHQKNLFLKSKITAKTNHTTVFNLNTNETSLNQFRAGHEP